MNQNMLRMQIKIMSVTSLDAFKLCIYFYLVVFCQELLIPMQEISCVGVGRYHQSGTAYIDW
jgi:hypothetical protein